MALRLLLPPSAGAARASARAELLDQSLRADLGEPVEVDVADDYADLLARSDGHDAHLVWLPPTLCARLEPTLRALFKCRRHGSGSYRSAILGRRGELIGLAGLRGKRAAWVDELSVGGHLLARAALREGGVEPEDLASSRFYGSYPRAIAAVLDGEADVAALMVRDDSREAVREALAAYGGRAAAETLSALFVTGPSPNDAVGLTQALDERRAKKLATRVFEREGARARAAFCLAFDAEGFTPAAPGEYAALRALIDER